MINQLKAEVKVVANEDLFDELGLNKGIDDFVVTQTELLTRLEVKLTDLIA